MKTLATLTIAGISGIVLLKLFATILLPLLGLLLGFLAMTVKLALIAGVIFFVYSMIKRRKAQAEA